MLHALREAVYREKEAETAEKEHPPTLRARTGEIQKGDKVLLP